MAREIAAFRCAAAGFVAVIVSLGIAAQEAQGVKTMAAESHPSFEVATIKRSDPKSAMHGFNVEGRRVLITNQTARIMIEMAYGVCPSQILKLPSWAEAERFDVEGVPDAEGQPRVVQLKEMVRKLLKERFGLELHTEKHQMPRYALTVMKGGPKMEPTKSGADALPNEQGNGNKQSMSYQMTNVSMEELAGELQGELNRPVVNETGLKARYDFSLRWSREDASPEAENSVPGLFTAIQEQAGLKLEPSKGDVDVLVIDQLERPSTN